MAAAVTDTSASQQQLDYMNLMITQLRNQDPLSPMDNAQMAQQLASLSQLQLTETLNTSFTGVLAATQMTYAQSLLGKQITFMPAGSTTATTDLVTGVDNSSGSVMLKTPSGNCAVTDVIDVLASTQLSYAQSLVGRQVTFMPSGATKAVTGLVTDVGQTGDTTVLVTSAGNVPVTDILGASKVSQ
jgi:flagellar basal-body rod modification protein FlgD